ncbi:hypothetical protein V5E97_01035 [Singulisphaera sp. Ch08]|uniref:Uncharacterized protein n=1 Tax=Singulisphaera sp. Ch08 TaxID=3120278 RepID=A0AAU7CHA3_9BACT
MVAIKNRSLILLVLLITMPWTRPAIGAGQVFKVQYPPSDKPGELVVGVTYRVWIPDGVTRLRGLIIHQHGCGRRASLGGRTAADDLHWQALAKKWDCALLGPSYRQSDDQRCPRWCDPRLGSRDRFLQALDELAESSGHAELATVPWCLWGHSGGAIWASLMQISDPERVVGVWLRSGSALGAWEKDDLPKPAIPKAVYEVPVMCNPGTKENADKRFDDAWTGTLSTFRAYREQGAPIAFAPDPRTKHECGDSRYLAIPFFDACLAARLPDKGSRVKTLKPFQLTQGWLAPCLGDTAVPAAEYRDDPEAANWLPNERIAKAWMEYVKTGTVGDATPPSAPFDLKSAETPNGGTAISWDATADLESGIEAFIIQRDGQEIGRVPEKRIGRFGRPLFQVMSYHDTPEVPLPAMRFVDPAAKAGIKSRYQVIAVNGQGIRSEPSPAAEGP